MTIRALVFDAYGTLYDVQSVLAKAEALCSGKGEVVTQIWRLKQLEYTWLRSLLQEYEDFWAVTGASLGGRKLAILSNGSPRMLQELVRNSGLDRWIETAISIDSVRAYKPHQSCYALVEPALGVTRAEVLFVSSNSFDVVGAKAFGFNVAWVRRSAGGPATMFGMLRGRAEELGRLPDHTVSVLTDLPGLL